MKGMTMQRYLLRVFGVLLTAGLLISQTACSNQESDTAQLVQTVNLGKPAMAVAWRPDGKQFAAVGFGNLGVWGVGCHYWKAGCYARHVE